MLYLLLSFFICTVTGAQILPGARQSAVCNSDVASSDDVNAVFNNPAGLSQIPWREIGIYYSPSPFGLKELANGFLAINQPTAAGTLSAGIMTYGYNLYRENKFLAAWSGRLIKNIFTGAAINYHYVSIHNYGSDGSIYLNLGTIAYLTPEIRFGFNIINLNHATFGNEKDQIPVVINSGFSLNFSDCFLMHVNLQKDKIYKYSASGGIEYSFLDLLTIRCGISTEPVKYSAGTGVHISFFTFDYAFSMHPELGITHQAGLIFSFNEFSNRQSEIKSFLGMNED